MSFNKCEARMIEEENKRILKSLVAIQVGGISWAILIGHGRLYVFTTKFVFLYRAEHPNLILKRQHLDQTTPPLIERRKNIVFNQKTM